MRSRIIVACAAAAGLQACAAASPEQQNASLKAATAEAVPQAAPDRIEIISPERLRSKWVWQAKIDGKTYACDADDQMRLPSCQAAG